MCDISPEGPAGRCDEGVNACFITGWLPSVHIMSDSDSDRLKPSLHFAPSGCDKVFKVQIFRTIFCENPRAMRGEIHSVLLILQLVWQCQVAPSNKPDQVKCSRLVGLVLECIVYLSGRRRGCSIKRGSHSFLLKAAGRDKKPDYGSLSPKLPTSQRSNLKAWVRPVR